MCDALVATGAAAEDGISVFAKNSDRKHGECQVLLQYGAAHHAPGSRVRCTYVAVPQVAETYAVLGHSPWWVWGFEHGVNEHAVALGNLTVFSREPVEEEPGLIGMDLVRLGLERGRDAREALEVIAGLLETNGQGGPALAPGAAGYHNAFLVADPREAWVLQTSRRHWAAKRVELDALSNHLSLGSDWEIASRELERFARAEGWWAGDARLDVAAAYRNPHVPGAISEGRLRRSRELLEANRGAVDEASMRAALRDHGSGREARQPGDSPEDESYYTLCMHSEPVGTTTASMVAALPSDRTRPWPVWISFGTPCTGTFVPVYLDGVIPDVYARGDEKPDDDSGWWTLAHLQEAAERDLPATTPVLREAWSAFDVGVERDRVRAEADAAEAILAGEGDRAAAILSAFMDRTAESALALARDLRERIR